MRHALFALCLLALSLGIGMVGYHQFEKLPYIDAFLNSAMLLGGMGPVDIPHSAAGKIFAGLYALYSGILFLVMATLMTAPFLHRLMHRFHWSDKL
jgi:hypothetical protein